MFAEDKIGTSRIIVGIIDADMSQSTTMIIQVKIRRTSKIINIRTEVDAIRLKSSNNH